MPAGDVRHERYRGGWGGGGSDYYDDEGRGQSKTVWEWFETFFKMNDYDPDWLLNLDEEKCSWLVSGSTTRYGLEDITDRRDGSRVDSRASRLVIKKIDKETWIKFNERLWEQHEIHMRHERERQKIRNAEYQREVSEAAARREAERAEIERENVEQVSKVVDATAGIFRSEMEVAFTHKDKIGYDGDWIEEVVDSYIDGSGFGYEQEQAVGVKLQITVSLDLSNSMYYNNIAIPAAEAFRDVALTLRQLKDEYPEDLFVEAFTFAANSTWDNPETAGRIVKRLNLLEQSGNYFASLGSFRPSALEDHWQVKSKFNGEDTWIKYLFQAIQRWEEGNSDPGAIKIDLIITDAVLEHPYDIRDSDVIQETRDGNLQSVMLNFLDEEEWLGSTLPKRCYHVKVDANNVAGILRNVLSEFVAVHI